ncbi:MAG TPA: SUF system Fe-S cluster assembly regulator [Coxiellaceae bacterium]|nr:SUF system Fe-S cluster assembly regulator [Coxiellaceae bacterium]
MLKISKLADYALVLMGHLSKTNGRYSATQLAQAAHLSVPTTSKVLKLLNEVGLLSSERGSQGGYQLTKAAAQISVAEIIAAMDGRVMMTECGHGRNQCEHESHCSLKANWRLINKAINSVLNNISLEDMTKPLAQPIHFHKLPKN